MPQYLIVYLGGEQPSNPEEGKQHFSKYMAWLSSLGNAAVSPASTVTNGSKTTMSGYTIIEADSMETALSIAKDCPFLDIGGYLEVSELVEMPEQKKT